MTASALTGVVRRLGRRVNSRTVESAATNLFFVAGLSFIALGLAMIWVPVGVIFAGIELAACAVLYERGRMR